jgi:hypothetical protein
MATITSVLRKLTRKLGMTLLVGVLVLIAYSLWLFIQEPASFEVRRLRLIAAYQADLSAEREIQSQLRIQQSEVLAEVALSEKRLALASHALTALHALDPGIWDRMFGDVSQQQVHRERIKRVEAIKAQTAPQVVGLQRTRVAIESRIAEVEARCAYLEQELRALEAEQHALVHYLRVGWIQGRWLVFAVLAAYLFGRFFVALVFYYAVAPRVVRGKTIQLVKDDVVLPVVTESALSIEEELWPGEVLRVRPAFLQAYDEGLVRRRCQVLNWRRFFSCLASGLTGLVELRNARNSGARCVNFGSVKDAFAEVSIVSVPDSGSFILRAGFLMGVITQGEKPVVIRRHLRLFHWQSWVSGRFGYWQFSGPCRLLVSCVTPLNVEVLSADENGKLPSQRAVQAGVVGFSPQLALRPVRCLGFWNYYRGRRPLYEVELTGCGVFLTSEYAGRARLRMRGNEGPAVKLLKLLGL